jgi:hypothetical protein
MAVKAGPKNASAKWKTKCYFQSKFQLDLIATTQKIKVTLTPNIEHNITLTFDLDLEMVSPMGCLLLRDNNTRNVI